MHCGPDDCSFQRLGVRLQTIAQLPEQLADYPIAHGIAPLRQRARQLARALTGPAQGRLWVPTGHRVHQPLQLLHNRGRLRAHPLAPPACVPDALSGQYWPGQVLKPPVQRGTIQPRRSGNTGNPTISQHLGIGGSHQAALALIEMRQDGGILLKQAALLRHGSSI